MRSPPLPRLVWVVLALFGVVLFLGALTRLSTHFLGVEYVDHYGTQWFYWYAERQVLQGEGFGHTNLFFFPYGKDIFLHTGSNLLDAIADIPFRAILGPILGYNSFVLVALFASGVAFYALAREFTEDAVAAGVAAIFVTLSPYVLTELAEGRPTQAFLLFPALFLRELWRAGTRPGLRAPLLAGLWLALSGYQYWYYAFFGGMVALAHGLWRTADPAPGSGARLSVLLRHAAIALVAGLLVAPVAWPLFSASASGEVPGLLDISTWTASSLSPVTAEGTTVGVFLWQPFRGNSGFLAENSSGELEFLTQGVLTPWVSLLALPFYLLRPGRLDRGPFLAMMGTSALLAMGPVVLLGDAWLPNLPYQALMKHLAFVRRLWWPARAYVFENLLYGLAIAVVFAWLGTVGRRVQAGVVLLASAAWLWHLHLGRMAPFPMWDGNVPAGYRCLEGRVPGDAETLGAVIELPYSWTQAHLYWQTTHGRPILGGMLENNDVFSPEEAVTLRQDNSFVAALLDLSKSEGETLAEWTEADKAAVHALGYRYVVLQRDAFAIARAEPGLVDNAMRARLRHMRQQLSLMVGQPIYEDARINLYAPWGDPLPCDKETISQDKEALGNTETVHGLRAPTAPYDTRVRALLGAPAAESTP